MNNFPNGFMWGAATAAYQIEGGWDADDKGLSNWDVFTEQPGTIFQGHTGKSGPDHYTHWASDVDIMRDLNLMAYRLSMSWARFMPQGVGEVSERGARLYDKLFGKLQDSGIAPLVTLFHWDYPQALQELGGWLHPDSPKWFADYAYQAAKRYGDRVEHWITLNEPGIFIILGYLDGHHAPGWKLGKSDFFQVLKNVCLGHGLAVDAIRSAAPRPVKVSFAPHCVISIPKSEDSEADVAAAHEATFGSWCNMRGPWQQRFFCDPVLLGQWPEDGEKAYSGRVISVTQDELKTMSPKVDFLGLNFYSAEVVTADEDGKPVIVSDAVGMPRTLFDWAIRPEGLYWTVRLHAERYNLPIIITENGLSNMDWISVDGKCHDPQRIDFLTRYLQQLNRAIGDGYRVDGYMHWSLMDNFEWTQGYKHRFGLIHIDYETHKRTVKDSGYWYREVIRSNGGSLFA
ncbi:MAG: family 1 glycosylhydrolase [Fimbriimonadaceae bacterium]|nr:family 1 glycosylhydrolase [Fimbriimonadaceae bacterium]QYK54940.1 MAG: family 1 glycosylhydrolase [Fimbriimonadaceae bacterium]